MNRDVCIVSPGAYNFADYLFGVLDCDFTYLNQAPPEASTVILFGVFFSCGDVLTPLSRAKRKIAVWIGTDVMQLEYYLKGHRGFEKELNKWIDVKLADAPNLAEELESLGIKIDGVVETPPRNILSPMPLPKDFTVGIYAPVKREEHYYTELCLEVAKAMPDVQFRVYGRDREFAQIADNVFDLGFINVKQEMPELSAIMRFTKHDGVAIGPVEYMQAGRRVVTNLDIPFARRCEPDLDVVVSHLREIAKETKPDVPASDYWRERLNHEKYKEQMDAFIYA